MNTSPYVSAGTEGSTSRSVPSPDSSVSVSGAAVERAPWKAVYCVAERGKGRRLWLRIGTAFPNRDGSLTIRLDAVPLSGQLQVREPFVNGPREGDSEPLLSDKSATETK